MMRKFMLAAILITTNVYAADQAELAMQEGLKILKEKPDSVIQAAGFFAKAADAFEAKGDQVKAAEANSCLYWTRKKFTVRDLGIVTQGNPVAAKRMEKIITEKPKDDVASLLANADEFAKTAKDPLLIAIRYFEIADRFSTTEEGRKAMDASLKSMQQIITGKPTPKGDIRNTTVDNQWFVIGHSGGWNDFVITETKLKVSAEDDKVSIENTENFADMTLLRKTLLTKDFVCKMRVSIENPSHVKFTDKINSCLYVDLPKGRSEVIIKRENGVLSLLINGRKAEIKSYLNGKQSMDGYVGFELRTGNKIELLSCELQQK